MHVLLRRTVNFDILELFCASKIVDAFWNDVFDWILARFSINIPSNNFHKLFAFYVQYVNNHLVNLVVLSAKFLTYRCKYSKTTPNMLQYFCAIKSIKNSEHRVAKKHIKWQLYLCFIFCFYCCVLVFRRTKKK